MEAAVHKVTQEQVVCVRALAAHSEQLQQVVELAVDVAADLTVMGTRKVQACQHSSVRPSGQVNTDDDGGIAAQTKQESNRPAVGRARFQAGGATGRAVLAQKKNKPQQKHEKQKQPSRVCLTRALTETASAREQYVRCAGAA